MSYGIVPVEKGDDVVTILAASVTMWPAPQNLVQS